MKSKGVGQHLRDNLWWASRIVGAGYLFAALLSTFGFLFSGGDPLGPDVVSDYSWAEVQIGYAIVALVFVPLLTALRPLFRSIVGGGVAIGLLSMIAFLLIGSMVKGEMTVALLEGALYILPWTVVAGCFFIWALRRVP